jgi:hypothetical protein
MLNDVTVEGTRVLVKPRRSLLTTALLSAALAFIPVFGVLYWFALAHDSWQAVAIVNVIVVLIGLALVARQLTVNAEVTATELRGNGIFTLMVHVPLERISSVLLVPTYVGQAPEAVTQLLVRDVRGRRLFRMRGNFWHAQDLRAIADSLPVRLVVIDEPIALSEFFRQYPDSAYWFEDKPGLKVFLIGSLIAGALAIAVWVMTILGMPIGFIP